MDLDRAYSSDGGYGNSTPYGPYLQLSLGIFLFPARVLGSILQLQALHSDRVYSY